MQKEKPFRAPACAACGLETTDRIALALGWAVKNASINEFKYRGDRFSMTGFNMTPHFDEDTYVTFR